MSSAQPWPLRDLRLKTPRLELCVPTDADLDQLAQVACDGIHDPAEQPFTDAWTDKPPEQLADGIRQWEWSRRGKWKPEDWTCAFAVKFGDVAIGVQAISGKDFSLLREVRTGSWLGLPFQGHGYGTEMRTAVLHLAFELLGATHARTTAMAGNRRSLGVTRKLGYERNGNSRVAVRGKPTVEVHYVLTRGVWLRQAAAHPVEVTGFDPCRRRFGLE